MRGRVPGRHGHQVPRGEQAVERVLAVEPRYLQLAEQVLAAGGRPVAAQPDLDSRRPRGVHARGAAVEQQVAERRPDHGRLLLREHVEVFGQQARGVDAGKRVVERPLVLRDLQRQEVAARDRTAARLGSVTPSLRCSRKQLSSFLSRARNFLASFASTSAMRPCASGRVGIVGLLDVADESAVEALDPGVAGEHDALGGGDAAEQALALDVAHQRRRGAPTGRARPDARRSPSWGR